MSNSFRMTAQEWDACGNSHRMWTFLKRSKRFTLSDRKFYLIAAGCCRTVWEYLVDDRSRRAVEMIEAIADGHADKDALRQTARDAYAAWAALPPPPDQPAHWAASTVAYAVNTDPILAALGGTRARFVANFGVNADRQSEVMRDIVGNPFRPVRVAGECLRWNDHALAKIARGVYEERAFERMPILADALEDAGCDNGDLLAHCRAGGEHVRGCWVVDLLLGKS